MFHASVSVCVCVCVCVWITQSYLTLCYPMDYSSPGSAVHGILQARILNEVAIAFFRDLPDLGSEPGLLHCRKILYPLSHVPCLGSLLLTSYSNMVTLSQLMNQYWHIIKIHRLFKFSYFVPNILFLFQKFIQDKTLHFIIMSPQIPLDSDNFSDFPYF